MVRCLLLSLLFSMLGTVVMAQSTSLYGKITDEESGEELIGANIVLEKNGVFATGAATDFEGNYSMSLDAGTYDAVITYTGYADNKITGILVKSGQNTKLNIQLSQGKTLDEVVVTGYKVPLIEQDNTTSGQTLTSEQIRSLPTKNISAIAASAAGASQSDEGDAVNIKGSRSNGTDYYIDGIRVRGANLIPQSEIDQLQVITGGIEARYGDVTGGIISITTKGPSSRFSGGVEVETSEYLDAFGYNLVSANFSGPILKNKKGESIIGFRVSGQYVTRKDDDPPATDIFKIKDNVLQELEANPVTVIGASSIPSAEFLQDDDVEKLDFQPNERSSRYDFTAKLDARLTKAIDVTFTGSYNTSENLFTPNEGNQSGANWRLLNSHNNPYSNSDQYRGNFRFRHRLGTAGSGLQSEGDEGAAKKKSFIQNAQYVLQGGYEKRLSETGDSRHKDRFFDYGYIGNFENNYIPVFDDPNNTGMDEHVGYTPELVNFTAGTQNSILNNYNNNADLGNFNDFVVVNGQFRGSVTSAWGFHTNVGQIYNRYTKTDNDILTLNVTSSFDFIPSGDADKGRHSIEFGINYEQRYSRSYATAPFGVWQTARQQANRNILGVGTDSIGTVIMGTDTMTLFNTVTTDLNESLFYRSIRNITGQGLDEYVNVDGLRPDQLSYDMFSAQELNDIGSVSYLGFDHTGRKLGNEVTFDDFFRAEDANGIRTFPVAPFNPIYASAYIQDKFTFKDIIFRLGVRVDRYDANTKVLKDLYSLYDVQEAGDFYNSIGKQIPAAVGNDYKVYTDGEGSDVVKAFRKGDQWYDATGTAVNGGNVIFGGQVVTPRLINENANIKDRDFQTEESFEDYRAELNWMPRLAFSFPISDEANFFAHYDILVQRPPSNAVSTALDYYYFNERPGTDANPFDNSNLKPEKTIDYEVGFQQKLGATSAIKLAAYYKELRDMIQRRSILFVPAPINQYVTYGNLDFGTVKGFTFQYDLRRTGNISLQANYTLQFADGTGSNANSQRGISSRGNLRTLFPLNFDERHRLVGTMDYRYTSGKLYNGPVMFGKDILENFGVNVQAVGVSGRPYTSTFLAQKLSGAGTVGQINGSRLPWNFTVNLRVDKSFRLVKNPDARPLNLNVYFRVQNLLDRRNTIAVYSATGSPTDDGYLTSSDGQDELDQLARSNRDIESFLSSYQWRILNPNFFSLPRRIFLGAVFEF